MHNHTQIEQAWERGAERAVEDESRSEELGDRLTLVEFPNVGHMMFLEDPDKTAAAVISFLRSVPAGTP